MCIPTKNKRILSKTSRKFFQVEGAGSGRIKPLDIPTKLAFYLSDRVELNLSLEDFWISITLFQQRNRGRLQLLLLSFAVSREVLQ
jgi:hypothetical protein